MIRSFLKNNYAKVREINKKYKTPNVEMSPWVKFSLLLLRLYLIFLVVLLGYKFITLVR
ncbi:MAG: hypothetical protein HQK98_00055 [Nitrospirae bacterium]|nr:hypothetical protein [Nitrospirota bacterium]